MQAPVHGSRTISEADFGRLKVLGTLPAAHHSISDLRDLAEKMRSERDDPKDGPDDEENPFIPAGYTYLGQFVDHDLTFDTRSNFGDPASFEAASNLRTPRFDLDNVYGRGPDDQPYLYSDDDTGRLLLGENLENNVPDVMRNKDGRAIIGDPRNDENSIVVQIQSVFIRFHNKMLERGLQKFGPHGRDAFRWARAETRRHYQRMLLDDFLPRIVDPTCSTVAPIFAALRAGGRPYLRYYDLRTPPYMPLEFAVAAYRFGHSMIRPGYRMDFDAEDKKLFPIFAGPDGGLRGFKTLDPAKAINWHLFFNAAPAGTMIPNGDNDPNNAPPAGAAVNKKRTQLAYKIDTMLAAPITDLPAKIAPPPSSLAERNLRRGLGFGLPSGQAVAGVIGAKVLHDKELSVRGKKQAGGNSFADADRTPISKISPAFAGNAPLWFYILAEAEQSVLKAVRDNPKQDPDAVARKTGTQLGEVGGAIVVETFVGLMLQDPESVLNSSSGWQSINKKPTFSMAEMLTEIGAF